MSDITESDRTQRLRSIPLFSGLSDASLSQVLAVASEYEVPAGHVLIQRDQPGTGLFIIEAGRVVVERPAGGVELGEGEFFGELALLFDGAVHSLRVHAATPVRFLALAREDFTQLVESEPQFALAMLRVLAQRLWEATRS
ncbi:MAG TPA: cyclic nucleotide-binding domain-containing protein [Egibacteraceae bacterium]|nr:cyclic nucleotide-binding domain-containing protein [Egibacteraceae bacterium]